MNKLFFLSASIPFLTLFPLYTDVQPLFSMIGYLMILLGLKGVRLNRFEVFYLFFAFFFVFNINTTEFPGLYYHLRKTLSLFLVFPVLYIFSRKFGQYSFFTLGSVLVVLYSGVAFQLLAESYYYEYGSSIFNNKHVRLGVRGWKGWAPEPSILHLQLWAC